MNHTAGEALPPSPAATRRMWALFCAAATALLAYLFRDAWLHGHVLGQGDILFQYLPWLSHKPPGIRTANRLFHDVPTVFYPFASYAREAIRSGEFPLWATGIGAGHPFFASFQSAVLSPFSLLIYALPFPEGLTVNAAARLFAGGAGMFLYLHRLGLGTAASLFGGVAYLLNPFSVVWLEHPLSAAAAWLPWMLLAVDACVRRRDGLSIAALAIVTALALLSGHPETTFKIALLAGAYAIVRGIMNRCAIGALSTVAAGMLLGSLVSSVQVLPFLEYLRESRILDARAGTSGPLFTNPPASVVTTFVPEFFATPARNRYVLEGSNYAEQQVYPGIVVWLFAAVSLTATRFRALAAFFLTASAAAMLIMYGTPVADAAIVLLPPLRYAALSRFGLIAIAGTIIAAAIAVDALVASAGSRPRDRRYQLLAAALGSAAVIGIVAGFLLEHRALLETTRQWTQTIRAATRSAELLLGTLALIVLMPRLPAQLLTVAPAALVAIDLIAFGDGLHALTPRERSFPPLTELSVIHGDRDLFRVAGWSQTLLPNTALVYGVQDFRSYDGIGVRQYSSLLDAGFHFNGAAHEWVSLGTPHLLDALNIKYLLVPPDFVAPPGSSDRYRLVHDGPTRVYLNRQALPRAFLVDQVLRVTGDDARRTIRNGFDMRRVALLDRLPAAEERPQMSAGVPGEASIVHYGARKVIVKTDADGARVLVLTDVFYPGWRADVDGKETTIYRANHAFRGVPVPAGAHTVTFRYEPRSFLYGLVLSGVAVAAVGALAVNGTRRRVRLPARPS